MHQTCLLQPWCSPRSSPSDPRAASRRVGSGHGNIGLDAMEDTGAAVLRQHQHRTYSTRCSAILAHHEYDKAQQPQRAAMLAIGTANPSNCVPQDEYVDWYFRVTKSDHLTKLKAKMKMISSNSGIKKRYFYHTEDTLRDHPEFIDSALPSLAARQGILASAVPELTAAAATRAIAEWGRPACDVTHLVFATSSDAHMPGADLQLASLLGLRRSVQRTAVYFHGCSSGSAALRVGKDIAENNPGARVLVACAELSLNFLREAREDRPETLIMQSLFGDGAAAVILGAGGVTDGDDGAAGSGVERPLFELVSASQTWIPDTEDAAAGQLAEGGLVFRPSPKMPALLRQLIEQYLAEAVGPLGLGVGWNDLFWAVHPGGPAILDSVEAALALEPGKLAASRHVLREYGNMSGVSVIFVLDELWRRRHELDGGFGVILGLGPGVTVETMVLRARG
ncbi:hypothetical protein SEVIR_8G149100v4 [Setaria viridis]|uniref:Chalcone synthase n=1 Tax=Setaria viridis TaxID=4556 RepID=A0A4U6TKA3_SETVI|nr:bisdemethoxycurcumin synthase-like [Setaria viridis]TKW01009.1 hypothetical protein SEVIR_8G149100v2 [Setaria viridis]